jgi:hypothetical protein
MRKLLLLVLLLLITACSKEEKPQLNLFDTKEQAIHHYVAEESYANESFLELVLDTDETIVLIRQSKDVYSLGELAESNGKFSFTRISAWFDIGNTTGAMFNIKTVKGGNVYTIKLSKELQDLQSIYSEDYGIYLTVVEGERAYEDINAINAIRSIEKIGE